MSPTRHHWHLPEVSDPPSITLACDTIPGLGLVTTVWWLGTPARPELGCRSSSRCRCMTAVRPLELCVARWLLQPGRQGEAVRVAGLDGWLPVRAQCSRPHFLLHLPAPNFYFIWTVKSRDIRFSWNKRAVWQRLLNSAFWRRFTKWPLSPSPFDIVCLFVYLFGVLSQISFCYLKTLLLIIIF